MALAPVCFEGELGTLDAPSPVPSSEIYPSGTVVASGLIRTRFLVWSALPASGAGTCVSLAMPLVTSIAAGDPGTLPHRRYFAPDLQWINHHQSQ